MDQTARLPGDHPFKDQRFDLLPLYRWWRQSVVATVDHESVAAYVMAESGWSPRYLFMTLMSAGIAVLGLLLSSPAVVIGAMLVSPLMGPILGLGFSLATFDFAEMRRALSALLIGALGAVGFTALIVLVSPLREATTEILARTRPNLFDLLVALFAALGGAFAIIRGRGETIVGVAIATALMPPLAVVGYGIATWNMPILAGSLALFVTNFVTIALSATIMARLYGFGHFLSPRQSRTQTVVLFAVFVIMAAPLALSLRQIAREAVTVTQIRAFLAERFGDRSRVTQLDVDFEHTPVKVRSVVIAPRARAVDNVTLAKALEQRLKQPVDMEVDEVLLDAGATSLDAQRLSLQRAKGAETERLEGDRIARMVAVGAGVPLDQVMLDREHRRATATAAALPGASLPTYRALEERVTANVDGWTVAIQPPLGAMPTLHFRSGDDAVSADTHQAIVLSAWAARRWNIPSLAVPGLPSAEDPVLHPRLAQRRALAVAAVLRAEGVAATPAPPSGMTFRLSPPAP